MNHPLPDMMSGTMGKIREMIGANAIVGDPIVLGENLTIIPISKVSFGFAGGGSDFVPKSGNASDAPFGGGSGAGVNITPIAFLVCKDDNVRLMPIAVPASNTVDRILDQAPELLDRIGGILDDRRKAKTPELTVEEFAAHNSAGDVNETTDQDRGGGLSRSRDPVCARFGPVGPKRLRHGRADGRDPVCQK